MHIRYMYNIEKGNCICYNEATKVISESHGGTQKKNSRLDGQSYT